MNTAPIFDEAMNGAQLSTLDLNYWPAVVQIFESGKHKEAILEVLNYINREILKKYGNADSSEFAIPHGSLTIYLTIKDGKYSVSVPFLKMPEKNVIAIMRQVAEINFSTLTLPQIVLKDGKLWFEYSSPIEMSDPWKVYAVFEEICNNADYFDDIFIEKFGASRIEEMKVKKFTSEQKDRAWSKFKEYLSELKTYIDFCESRRLYPFEWDFIGMALMKIDYFMAPQGFLRSEIEKSMSGMYGKKQLNELLNQGKANVAKLEAFDEKKFEDSLYVPQIFISPKVRSDLQAVQNILRQRYEGARNEMGSADFMGASLSLLFAIYDLLYRNNVPADTYVILRDGLAASSGKPWKEAAEALWKSVNQIMEMKPLDAPAQS